MIFMVLFVVACSQKKDVPSEILTAQKASDYKSGKMDKYRIYLYKIDNLAKVYVNEDKIFDSNFIEGNPELNISVGLSDYLNPGKNEVKVELYNGGPLWEMVETMDERWEIFYEIFRENEPIEYNHEQARDGKTGLVFSATHEIFVQ